MSIPPVTAVAVSASLEEKSVAPVVENKITAVAEEALKPNEDVTAVAKSTGRKKVRVKKEKASIVVSPVTTESAPALPPSAKWYQKLLCCK